jgi:hypothetical protein
MRRSLLHTNPQFAGIILKTVLAAGYLITGIQYIQDADRFLADEEVDWHGATSAAMSDCMCSPSLVSAAMSDISLTDFGKKYIGSAWRCHGDSKYHSCPVNAHFTNTST